MFSLCCIGALCEDDIDECSSNPCLNSGRCIDQINGFRCSCPHGYYDYICASNINECDSSPCVNNGRCIDGINRLVCLCKQLRAGCLSKLHGFILYNLDSKPRDLLSKRGSWRHTCPLEIRYKGGLTIEEGLTLGGGLLSRLYSSPTRR